MDNNPLFLLPTYCRTNIFARPPCGRNVQSVKPSHSYPQKQIFYATSVESQQHANTLSTAFPTSLSSAKLGSQLLHPGVKSIVRGEVFLDLVDRMDHRRMVTSPELRADLHE